MQGRDREEMKKDASIVPMLVAGGNDEGFVWCSRSLSSGGRSPQAAAGTASSGEARALARQWDNRSGAQHSASSSGDARVKALTG